MQNKYVRGLKINIVCSVCLVLLLSRGLMAQKATYLNIFGIVQHSYIYNKQEWQSEIVRNTPGWGSALGFQFVSGITDRVGVLFGMYGSKQEQGYRLINYHAGNEVYRGSRSLIYLKIPILLTYKFVKKNKYSLYVGGGTQVDFLLKSDGSIPYYVDVTTDGNKGVYPDPKEPANAYKDFAIDLAGQVGLDITISKMIGLRTAVTIDYSLSDIENKNYSYINNGTNIVNQAYYELMPNRGKTHTINPGILIGLLYKLQ